MTALFAHRPIDRRTFLRKAVGGAAALAAPSLLAGCGGGSAASYQADAAPWRRYAGTTLNFISENTSPTAAIAANKKPFTDLTGINLNIVQLELSALVQKVALDFASGSAAYQVIYADPYQVLAPYAKGLYDLRGLMGDANLPQPKPGLSDFIPTQLDAAGRFIDKEAVYALPYDCPTLIWQYRADLFAKHKDAMSNDLGFDPTPSGDRTWEEYYRIAALVQQKSACGRAVRRRAPGQAARLADERLLECVVGVRRRLLRARHRGGSAWQSRPGTVAAHNGRRDGGRRVLP